MLTNVQVCVLSRPVYFVYGTVTGAWVVSFSVTAESRFLVSFSFSVKLGRDNFGYGLN